MKGGSGVGLKRYLESTDLCLKFNMLVAVCSFFYYDSKISIVYIPNIPTIKFIILTF